MTNNKERTFIVYKGSHLLHEAYFKQKNIDEPRNWHIFDEEYINSLHHLKQVLKVNKGDLVIWDSRSYHQNTCGDPDCMEERLVQYLCFLPKNSIDNNDDQKKKDLIIINVLEPLAIGHIHLYPYLNNPICIIFIIQKHKSI